MGRNEKQPKGQRYFLFFVLFLAIAGGSYYYFSSNGDVRDVVEEQLLALQQHDIQKAYYDFTSSAYQERISFPLFKQLVQAHSVLSQNESVRFYNKEQEVGRALLSAQLVGPHHQTVPVLYRLVWAGGEWKIDEMELSDYGAHQNKGKVAFMAETSQPQAITHEQMALLVQPIEGFFKALKEGRLDDAFKNYTAEDFKKATPHDAFIDFVKEFPELTHYSGMSVQPDAFIDNEHRGKVIISLIYNDKSYPVDFVVIEENGAWKIWGLRVQPAVGEKIPLKPQEQAPHNQVIQDHLSRLNQGSIDTAYIAHASDLFKEAISLDRYREFVKNYPEMTQYDELEIGQAEEKEGLHLVPVIFASDKGKSHFDFWFVNEKNGSKIWAVNVIDSAYFPPISEDEKKILSDVIKDQLGALRSGDISKAYYGYGSDDFEKATSFAAFKDFINNYPIFRLHTQVKIGDAVMEGELRLVKVELESDKETAEVDYRLNKEGKNWKIWGVQILTKPKEKPFSHDNEAIKDVLVEHFDAIRKGDVSKAYYAYTSKDFQEATSKDVFEKFVTGQSVYGRNAQFQLNAVTFNGDQAQADVEMRAKNGEAKSIEFKFIYEGGKWKIFSLKIIKDLTPATVAETLKGKRLRFERVLIGDQVNTEGLVIENKNEFDPKDHEITVNLFIGNGVVGTVIEVQLEHLETSSKIPAIKTALTEEGNSVATFIFSAPPQGWPPGSYKLRVHASTGQEASYGFKVNRGSV